MATLKDAKKVAETILLVSQPLSIIVFGSVAKSGRGNDIDLLLIYDINKAGLDAINRKIHKNLKVFYKKFAVDPFVVTVSSVRDHFLRGSPFLRLIQREGRILYMKDSLVQWIKQSKEELDTAKYLLKGHFFRGACYHSQQTIEKSLKTVLIKKGWELEKIHNIERLAAIIEDYGVKLEIDDDDIVFIDSIYRGRYPGEEGVLPLREPGEKDAERAVIIAKNILMEVDKLL